MRHKRRRWLVALSLMSSTVAMAADSAPTTGNSGYAVDGRTSASVLAAQRSHSVSSKDQTILSVVSGLLAIGGVIFLVKVITRQRSR